MDRSNVYDEPSTVTADEGVVDVDGPDGVEVQLTPEAAVETSDRLLDKAAEAAGLRVRARRTDRDAPPQDD